MMLELQLKLKEEAIKVYQETGLTPEKLLNMYKISVSTLEVNLDTMKFMFSEEQKLQEKLSQQNEKLQKLVNQSESL
jgi:antitoxin component of RelBE/YafQ-DinJ toxin-antitoxin module